jgi:hypothetical protein
VGDDQEDDRREMIIARVLARMETDTAIAPAGIVAAVLRLRRQRPRATVEDLARELSIQIGTPVSPEAFRILLRRARHRFLELLDEEGGMSFAN